MHIQFCFKLGKTTSEVCEILKLALRDEAVICIKLYEWFSEFKSGVTSVSNAEHLGHSFTSTVDEMWYELRNFFM